ncbi:type-2 ice-structuring protein-like [Antennarius striatus]|uniref:type-2 ice-structuring protein-like n=1 Tax=Antennarius striatus TaxID=241820 RepID=UPI0035B0E825
MLVTADAEFNQTFIMFLMKTQLLVCLLGVFLSVGAAAVVPVEGVPEGGAVPVPVEATADVTEARAELSVPGAAPEEPLNVQTLQRSASQCPEGWQPYKDHCYLMVNLMYNRINAEFLCESLNSSLASIHNLWEHQFLKELTWKAGFNTAWIGGYNFQGYWRWDDGTPFNYNNWYSNDGSSYKPCNYLNSNGVYGWSNKECTDLHASICSMKVSC